MDANTRALQTVNTGEPRAATFPSGDFFVEIDEMEVDGVLVAAELLLTFNRDHDGDWDLQSVDRITKEPIIDLGPGPLRYRKTYTAAPSWLRDAVEFWLCVQENRDFIDGKAGDE